MKNGFSCSILFVVVSLTASLVTAQEPPVPEPTEQHKLHHRDVGTWKGEMKMSMGPDAEPMTLPVSETNEAMQGGLWVITNFEAGPFKGHGQFGYDPQKKKHVGTWVDNMSPHMSVMSGDYDKKSGEMTLYSTGFDAMSQKMKQSKSVTKFDGVNKKSFLMYQRDKDGDEWVQVFEINYTKES